MRIAKEVSSVLLVLITLLLIGSVCQAAGQGQVAEKNDDTYVIGAGDVLSIQVWREPNLSGEFTVRPDGRITFPLLNDIKAQGLTPLQLKKKIEKGLTKYISTPVVTVVVQSANSKNIFILGKVNSPGKYPLTGPTTVLQALAQAGGLAEWAKSDEIVIVRNENGKQIKLEFDYDEVSKGKHLEQNIILKPGDTIVVP
ncbi:MAG: polysaccharide export protein [Thermodesulfobacteria bacterium]|nr:polysaccharide export protein [Thermodesulfobacteriota bacterium]